MEEVTTAADSTSPILGLAACFLMGGMPIIFIISLIMTVVRKSKGWAILTVGSVVVGFVGLIIVGALAPDKESGDVVAAKEAPAKFELTNGGAFLQPKGKWTVVDMGFNDTNLEIGNQNRLDYYAVFVDEKKNLPADFLLSDFAAVSLEFAKSTMSGVEIAEPVKVNIGGMAGIQQELVGTAGNIEYVYLCTFLEGKNRFYHLLGWTQVPYRDTSLPVLEEVAATFRETGPKAP